MDAMIIASFAISRGSDMTPERFLAPPDEATRADLGAGITQCKPPSLITQRVSPMSVSYRIKQGTDLFLSISLIRGHSKTAFTGFGSLLTT